jgi:hypothetical protein
VGILTYESGSSRETPKLRLVDLFLKLKDEKHEFFSSFFFGADTRRNAGSSCSGGRKQQLILSMLPPKSATS